MISLEINLPFSLCVLIGFYSGATYSLSGMEKCNQDAQANNSACLNAIALCKQQNPSNWQDHCATPDTCQVYSCIQGPSDYCKLYYDVVLSNFSGNWSEASFSDDGCVNPNPTVPVDPLANPIDPVSPPVCDAPN